MKLAVVLLNLHSSVTLLWNAEIGTSLSPGFDLSWFQTKNNPVTISSRICSLLDGPFIYHGVYIITASIAGFD